MFYKITQDDKITFLGKTSIISYPAVEITEEKYNQLIEIIQNKPDNTLDATYYLSDTTETYISKEPTYDEKVIWYVSAVTTEQLAIEEVPEEYREAVEENLPITPEQEFVNRLLEEVNA